MSAPARKSVAREIKGLQLDGEPVVIAVAGVSVGSEHPDEDTLREIASPECYVHIDQHRVPVGLHRIGRQFGGFPRRGSGESHQADPGIGHEPTTQKPTCLPPGIPNSTACSAKTGRGSPNEAR